MKFETQGRREIGAGRRGRTKYEAKNAKSGDLSKIKKRKMQIVQESIGRKVGYAQDVKGYAE